MDTVLNTAVATQAALRQFLAVRIELTNGYTINLIDGSGFVTFSHNGVATTFRGSDPTFGTLATATSIEEKVADEAPTFSFSLLPPTANALGTLSDPRHQSSPVFVYWGCVNEQTGAVIGTPELLWSGRLNTVKTQISAGTLIAECNTVSAFDRLFVAEEGARLNRVWHNSIWPGETGLDFCTAALQDPWWGVDAPATNVKSTR